MVIDPFLIKLIFSFIIGGLIIALLSILAEKYPKIGGLIISIPSTLLLGLIFIGWSQNKYVAIESASIVPSATGVLLIFSIIYIYGTKLGGSRKQSLLLSNSLSLIVWFILAFLVVHFKIRKISGIIFYLVCFILSLYLLRLKFKESLNHISKRLKFSYNSLILRSIFAGGVIVISVILAKILNPLWGGVFSVFPAAYLSSFNIIQLNRGKKFLFNVGRTVPPGSILFIIYAYLVSSLFNLGILIGTILSLGIIILIVVLFNRLFTF